MSAIPTTYVYVAQVQMAHQALGRALEAMSDQVGDGTQAEKQIQLATKCIQNIDTLLAKGIKVLTHVRIAQRIEYFPTKLCYISNTLDSIKDRTPLCEGGNAGSIPARGTYEDLY